MQQRSFLINVDILSKYTYFRNLKIRSESVYDNAGGCLHYDTLCAKHKIEPTSVYIVYRQERGRGENGEIMLGECGQGIKATVVEGHIIF